MLIIVVNLLGGNFSPSHHTTYCVFSRCHAFIRLYILEKITGVDVKAHDILRKAGAGYKFGESARHAWLHDEITILPTAVLESVQTLSTLIRIHGQPARSTSKHVH
jgi:hypothetical protein